MTRNARRRMATGASLIRLFPFLVRFGAECARLACRSRAWPGDDLLVRAGYRALLDREPDPNGYAYFLGELQHGRLPRYGLPLALAQSSEFKLLRALGVRPGDLLHRARMRMVREWLPPADVVVDLGGAAPEHPHGALILMGYPHRPRRLYVVDLSDDDRAPVRVDHVGTPASMDVIRLSQSMAQPLPIEDGAVDLVFAGESIEHVSEVEAEVVIREAHRVLRSGGSLCLDTPNAALTRLESPEMLIHPEHKREYRVDELVAKLGEHGFRLEAARGLCPMPVSVETGVFDWREIAGNVDRSGPPEEGYLFFLHAIKGGA